MQRFCIRCYIFKLTVICICIVIMPSLKKSFWKKLIKSIRLWPLSRLKKYLKSRQKVFTRIDKHLKNTKEIFRILISCLEWDSYRSNGFEKKLLILKQNSCILRLWIYESSILHSWVCVYKGYFFFIIRSKACLFDIILFSINVEKT